MPRYVAFLRGVMPTNAKMPELRRSFERAGFTNVKTVLGSGNVIFDAPSQDEAKLVRKAEAAMMKDLGRTFYPIVRLTRDLQDLIEADPFGKFPLPADAKRVVTFLRETSKAKLSLPLVSDGVHILSAKGREVFIGYLPNPRGPVFMTLIERTFGSNVTTRTWDTVKKCASA